MPVYHGKELWRRQGLHGESLEPEEIIRQRMVRDWSESALKLVRETAQRTEGVRGPFGRAASATSRHGTSFWTRLSTGKRRRERRLAHTAAQDPPKG